MDAQIAEKSFGNPWSQSTQKVCVLLADLQFSKNFQKKTEFSE